MIFIAKTEHLTYKIEVIEKDDRWDVQISDEQGQNHEKHLIPKKDYQRFGEVISFLFNNRSYLIDILIQGDNYTIFTKGTHKRIQFLTEEYLLRNQLTQQNMALAGSSIQSEMPGKVVKLPVQAGDKVSQGDLLLVIEAMKMENEIRASLAGKIKKLYVKEGDTVEVGTRLLSISYSKPPDS